MYSLDPGDYPTRPTPGGWRLMLLDLLQIAALIAAFVALALLCRYSN